MPQYEVVCHAPNQHNERDEIRDSVGDGWGGMDGRAGECSSKTLGPGGRGAGRKRGELRRSRAMLLSTHILCSNNILQSGSSAFEQDNEDNNIVMSTVGTETAAVAVVAHNWIGGIGISILGSIIGGASKLSIRKSCERFYFFGRRIDRPSLSSFHVNNNATF